MRLTLPLRQLSLRLSSNSTRRWLLSGLLGCSLCLATHQEAYADERQDFRTWSNFLKAQAALKLEPKDALASYDGFLQAHPTFAPNAAIVVLTYKADLLAKGLKDPDAAVTLLDQALAFYSQPAHLAAPASLLRLVRFKGQILASQKKWAEVELMLRDNWKQIIEVGQQAGPGAPADVAELVHQYVYALNGVGKTTEIAPVLLQTLSEVPGLLSGQGQRRDGSFYDDLVGRLVEAGRKNEALQWAKLQYVLCPFNAEALDRSTKLLARAWAGSDNFAAIASFGKAQGDAAAPNPLSEVKLPTLNAPVLQAQQARLEALKGKAATSAVASDLITLDLVAGRYGAAMQRARALLQARVDSPEGAQEVARVFKAADLNTLSANAFLSYIKGEGENPFPAFFEKHGQGNAAG